jgi:hypothetical protein
MKIIRGEIITANYNVIKELMSYLVSGSMSQMKISHNQSTTAAI